MTQRQVKKLSRKRLLQLLAEQTGKANRLEQENIRLKDRIEDREQYLHQMGKLAEVIVSNQGKLNQEQACSATAYLDMLREAVPEQGYEEEQEDPEGELEEELEEEPPGSADIPTREQLLLEISREGSRGRYIWSLKTTVYAMITVAAVAVLVAVLWLPVLQIYGESMQPTLFEEEFVVSIKGSDMDTGDLVAFYYNNKILIKRVIAQAGQWVDIDEDGTVYVDNVKINEPYLNDKALGECDIKLPYQVPENRVFVMGDNRSVSVDSRSTTIGCVAVEQLVGKIVFRIWPLDKFGTLS